MLRRAEEQKHRTGLEIEFLDLPGEPIPLGDASVDTVVSTFTLCTIPGVVEAIQGVRRVLKPGGKLVFVELGLSPILRYSADKSDRDRFFAGHSKAAT